MDASRYNSPSRKSRFRAQGGAPHRPASSAEQPTPEADEPIPAYAEHEAEAEADAAVSPDTGEAATEETDPVVAPEVEEEDSLPAGLRLTRSADEERAPRRGAAGWIVALASLLCLLLGGVGGYLLRANGAASAAAMSASGAAAGRNVPVLPLAPATLADVDAAFAANKAGQFADARHRFDALADKHPDWTSLRIESARSALYEHNFDAAGATLAAVERSGPNVDAAFLTGLLQMTLQAYDKAEAAFARAIAIDPARPDVFYFWGECLRREGKPQDAAEKFRQALLRNQYETAEGLYQLKLWLSEIQSDQEKAKDINAKIDADLASGHPSGPALFAAAAREIKAGRFKEAAARVAQAQKVVEPAVFRVILQDPTFLEQNFRPELAPFYQP